MSVGKIDFSVAHRPEPLQARLGIPADTAALQTFFAQDSEANLFHLGVLEEHGIRSWRGGYRYWLAFGQETGGIRGAVFLADTGMASPVGDPEAVAALGRVVGEQLSLRLVVGERTASDALWAVCGAPRPRVWRDHRLFVQDAPERLPALAADVRLARSTDAGAVVELAAAMRAEELGRTVAADETGEFTERVSSRIAAGRVYVLEHAGDVVFKADIGTRCTDGAQIEGVYVVPGARGHGVATGAVAEMTRQLLRRWPRVTLHVHEENQPAVRAYERAGFRATRPFRLILAD